jgi:hypothetical protein
MTRHSSARARQGNPEVKERKRFERRGNLAFFESALSDLGDAEFVVGLVGQRDLTGVNLRRAQAILRWDLRPSLWSHAFVITEPRGDKDVADVAIREVTLHPREGGFPDPSDNGVLDGRLGQYRDREVDANVALYRVPLDDDDKRALRRRAKDPNLDRVRYDLWRALGIWQAYFWSAGVAPNPLREAVPVPSSSFVEYCFDAIRLDLAPAASERNSAPEQLWNGARWWFKEFADYKRPVSGSYVLRDPYCTLLDPEELRRVRRRGVS